MDSVLSGASKKVLEMARKKDKFIEDKDGGGKMFSAAKLVAKGWVPVSSLSELKPNLGQISTNNHDLQMKRVESLMKAAAKLHKLDQRII